MIVVAREIPSDRKATTMAVTVRTIAEAQEAGLRIPTPFQEVDRHTYLVGHDNDDGALMVWGPASDREVVIGNARMYP